LGFAVGYTLDAVGPIIIASIVSICWFKEITGRRQLMPLGSTGMGSNAAGDDAESAGEAKFESQGTRAVGHF